MPKKIKKTYIKPVLNTDTPDTPFQYDVPGAVEKSKKVKSKDVFDFSKKKDKGTNHNNK